MPDHAYLYNNAEHIAKRRLKGLESIEDANTISCLKKYPRLKGAMCIELGAGAGSIAAWLADHVGEAGKVIATDIEPLLLNCSQYEVIKHNLETDDLPEQTFDLVHCRHLLIHLKNHSDILEKIANSLKFGGWLVAEESDLRSWVVDEAVSDENRQIFQDGVDAVLCLYSDRGINIQLGADLPSMIQQSGLSIIEMQEKSRRVVGGSPEAIYQSASADQLAGSLPQSAATAKEKIKALSICLQNNEVTYTSRTTVSVVAAMQ